MKRSMKLVIDVSKKGVLDKLNAFLESFQQLQLGEYENGTITYDEEKEDEINTLLKKCFLADWLSKWLIELKEQYLKKFICCFFYSIGLSVEVLK
mgnify:FL=1